MPGKFLIIQTAFLGDAILATALAESIHAKDPQAEISIMVRKGNEGLFKEHPFLHRVLVWNKKENKTRNLFRMISEIRNMKFDNVINLQRFFSTGLITALSGAKFKVGFSKNPLAFCFDRSGEHSIGTGEHEIFRNHQLLKLISDFDQSKPQLYPAKKTEEKIKNDLPDPYVVLTPASVWYTKQMPILKWVELGDLCKDKYHVVLAGGPGDTELCNSIGEQLKDNYTVTAGKYNLLESAALIKGAKMNYVNDSGPLHMASATNAPVTAFFCSTIPEFGFGPLSVNSAIIQSEHKPECKPCGLHGKSKCPLGHFDCGNKISINTSLIP